MTLYELTSDLMFLQEMLEETEDDVDEALLNTLEGTEGAYDMKIENYCKMVKNLEGQAKAIGEEAKRLNEKKRVIENNVARLKKAMMDSLQAVGKTEAGGTILKAKIAKNGGVLPLRFKDGANAAEVPSTYQRIEYGFNNEAIREALDAGRVLDFVEYGERGQSLRIK